VDFEGHTSCIYLVVKTAFSLLWFTARVRCSVDSRLAGKEFEGISHGHTDTQSQNFNGGTEENQRSLSQGSR
jgi:hypothetical protein